jgi:apolipoprotein N-acyltransferase
MPGKTFFLPWLAYGAFLPLFFCIDKRRPRSEVALCGFLYGAISSFILLRWIAFTISVYGNLGPFVGYLSAILLSLYCGIFFSIFSLIVHLGLYRWRYWGFCMVPFIWSGLEVLRSIRQEGFPWLLLGYSQYGDRLAREFAALGGVIGVGFLLMAINVCLYVALKNYFEKRKIAGILSPALLFLGILFLLHLPGFSRLGRESSTGPPTDTVKVLVVQPNIEQWKKWDEKFQAESMEINRSVTDENIEEGTELVIWPETALPFFYGWDEEMTLNLDNYLLSLKRPLITGTPWLEAIPEERYFNSTILFSREGRILSRYDKVKLVPFGEYVPLRGIFFFVDKITEGAEDFSAGRHVELLLTGPVKVVPAICYEAIFPLHSLKGVSMGGNLLVNITNDAWFGDTEAPYQQLYMAAFRAIETGRFMVRSSNSGISGVIGPHGAILMQIGLFKRGAFVAKVPLLTGMTFYTINAKLIHLCILGVGAIFVLITIIWRKKDGEFI